MLAIKKAAVPQVTTAKTAATMVIPLVDSSLSWNLAAAGTEGVAAGDFGFAAMATPAAVAAPTAATAATPAAAGFAA